MSTRNITLVGYVQCRLTLTIDWVVFPADDQQRMTVSEATSEMADGGTISAEQKQVSGR
jgi:hypothetical protein